MKALRAWGPWILLAVVVTVGLVLGTSHHAPPPSLTQRAATIASEVRCPSCEDLTAAESNSEAAVAIRSLIRTDLAHGQSKAQIESYLVGLYGPDIILRPSTHGLSGLVWLVPAALGVLGLAGAVLALRRWRTAPLSPDEADRALVEEALEPRS
ncbi:MAG TPA: cytochrome c-type biogenesis protein [Acidimicrobiales bacterium]|nr:cytochrome c-type biogenesis protein [Acidimicrobiales bacterium]